MKCPYCLQDHEDNAKICPVTGKKIPKQGKKPTYERTSDTTSWFGVGIIGVFFLIIGISMLNKISVDDIISNIGSGRNSPNTLLENLEGKVVDLLITQVNSKDSQVYAYTYDYIDPDGTWELEDENIYLITEGVYERLDVLSNHQNQISFNGRSRNPVWSPDGRFLAYVEYGSNDWNSGVIVIYESNTGQTRIIRGDFSPDDLNWSPDGTRIALHDIKHDHICIIDLSTEEIQIVDPDGHWVSGPTWSLDGRFLAYVQTLGTNTNDDDGWVLKLLNLETQKVSQITTTNDNVGVMRDRNSILWTADGKYLIYLRFELINGKRGPNELWVLDPYTLNTYKLTEDVLVVHQSYFPWVRLWSPNAEYITWTTPIDYYSSPSSEYEIASDSDGSQSSSSGNNDSSQGSVQQATNTLRSSPTTPPPTPTPAPAMPAGDPMIAYAYEDFDEADIYILYVNSGRTERITNNNFEDKSPSFSADNSKLVYSSKRNQGWELYTYDIETGEEKRITTFDGEAKFPNWSPIPGDDRIVFEGRKGVSGLYDINVWLVNSDGTGLEQLTFSNADNRPVWSGDGSVIIFGRATKDSNNNGRVSSSDNLDIFTIAPQSKTIEQITRTDDIDEFQFSSSPDGQIISFCAVSSDANNDGNRNLDDTRDLHFINIDGSNRSTIKVNNNEIFSPGFSPDGQFVTFNIWFNDDDSAIWLFNRSTGEITELTNRGPYYHPEWSN